MHKTSQPFGVSSIPGSCGDCCSQFPWQAPNENRWLAVFSGQYWWARELIEIFKLEANSCARFERICGIWTSLTKAAKKNFLKISTPTLQNRHFLKKWSKKSIIGNVFLAYKQLNNNFIKQYSYHSIGFCFSPFYQCNTIIVYLPIIGNFLNADFQYLII